jgi:hypothetical protein
LKTLVEIGYIYESLGATIPDSACSIVTKELKQINLDSPQTLFYVAEFKRLFKCTGIDKLDTSISSLLKDVKSLSEPSDLFHAFLLNRDAKLFGGKPSSDFQKTFTDKTVKDLVSNFNADDWSFNGQPFSLDSLRVAQLLSGANNTNADSKIKTALNKLLAQVYEDDQTFFVITKNANTIDNAEINLAILEILNSSNVPDVTVKGE